MARAPKAENAKTPVKAPKPAKPTKVAKVAKTVKVADNDRPSPRSGSVKVGRRASTRQPPSPEELNELARLWGEFK